MRNNSEPRLVLAVTEIIVHPQYNKTSEEHDVALLIVTGGDSLKAFAKLDDGSITTEVDPPHVYRIAGWGTTSYGGPASPLLRESKIEQVPQSFCEYVYGDNYIFPSMLCAYEDGTDTCQGDSGGPLFTFLNGEPVLVGVVSWGYKCAYEGAPGVYARVAVLRDFIDNNGVQPPVAATLQPGAIETKAPTVPSATASKTINATTAFLMPRATSSSERAESGLAAWLVSALLSLFL